VMWAIRYSAALNVIEPGSTSLLYLSTISSCTRFSPANFNAASVSEDHGLQEQKVASINGIKKYLLTIKLFDIAVLLLSFLLGRVRRPHPIPNQVFFSLLT